MCMFVLCICSTRFGLKRKKTKKADQNWLTTWIIKQGHKILVYSHGNIINVSCISCFLVCFGGSIFSFVRLFVCLKSFYYGHVIVSKVINDPPEIVPNFFLPQEERDFERGYNHHCDFISIQGVLIIHYRWVKILLGIYRDLQALILTHGTHNSCRGALCL